MTHHFEHFSSSHTRPNSINGLLTALCISLAGCSTKPPHVFHSFEFDARVDSPGIEILDWRYGTTTIPGGRGCRVKAPDCTSVGQQSNTSGDMNIGNDLYVKWKQRQSGEVFSETADLQGKLPHDMKDHTIRFIAHERGLHVYVITPDRLEPNPCPPRATRIALDRSNEPDKVVFSIYCYRKILKVHPVQSVVPAFGS